jgi:hypothetical protein
VAEHDAGARFDLDLRERVTLSLGEDADLRRRSISSEVNVKRAGLQLSKRSEYSRTAASPRFSTSSRISPTIFVICGSTATGVRSADVR